MLYNIEIVYLLNNSKAQEVDKHILNSSQIYANEITDYTCAYVHQ